GIVAGGARQAWRHVRHFRAQLSGARAKLARARRHREIDVASGERGVHRRADSGACEGVTVMTTRKNATVGSLREAATLRERVAVDFFAAENSRLRESLLQIGDEI